jgi:hypothetical protein
MYKNNILKYIKVFHPKLLNVKIGTFMRTCNFLPDDGFVREPKHVAQ